MYLGDRPRLVQLQEARLSESAAQLKLDRASWWRKPVLWWPWVVGEARVASAWDALTEQDWDAIAVQEIRAVARQYWRENGLSGNPFHPRALAHVDGVADAVAQQPEWELQVRDPRVTGRLTPDGTRVLYRAEIERLQQVAADPVMLTHDIAVSRFAQDHPGLRELVVQHQASGLRGSFFYGGDHAQVGWVVSKTYSVDSIDPDRFEIDHSRASAWQTYVGLGIGMKLYAHVAEVLPEVRWEDKSISPYGQAVRRKLHALDPWRWHLKDCGCSAEWDSLTRSGAPACPSDEVSQN